MKRVRRWLGGGKRPAAAAAATGTAEGTRVEPSTQSSAAANADQDTSFRYKPLPTNSTIRILHVQRQAREWNAPWASLSLRGSLIETAVDSGLQYFALSYTWGDPTPCENIEIDGKTLGITASCACALRRLLRGKTERYIWVDSICINQADTPEALEERGSQVAMMDQIYRGAEKVLVHLGQGDAASDVACKTLKSLTECYMAAKHGIGGPMEESRRKYEELADDALATTLEYPYGKLHGVFRLPWFRRTWVVQEVALGRNVMFYCGEYLMHLKTILIGADFTKLPYSKLDATSMHWRTYVEYHDSLNEFVRRREEGEPLSSIVGGLTLLYVLMMPAMTLEATRPEDKIYGLYGVCKRLGFELPRPDYKKSLATVYTEAARAILRYDSDLGILAHVCESPGWELGIPSWVPNFSGSVRQWTPTNPPHMPITFRTKSLVSGSSTRQHEYALDGQGLQVKGRRCSAISAAGLPWMTDATTTMYASAPMSDNVQVLESLLASLPSWVEVVQGRSDLPDEQRAMHILASALIQDIIQPVSGQNLAAFAQNLATMVRWATWRTAERLGETADEGSPSMSDAVVGLLGLQALAATLNRLIGMQWKTVFRTTDGRIGVGTHTLQNGDITAVLHGFSMVAILRPWGEWYRYVGPAYVDGIMNGEFWIRTSEMDDEWFTLV